jgi:heterodisulfide reductase subunit B
MQVSYYPGCSLHGTASEYDASTQAVSRLLGVELLELSDWNCCGASSAHSTNESLAYELAARNLAIAEREGKDVVIPCAACYSRLKAAKRQDQKEREDEIKILSLLEFLTSRDRMEKMKQLKKRSLAGLKVVCYYGCLLVRPPRVTRSTNYENPQEMDRLMAALGAEAIPWSYKTDCCGASLVLTRTDIVRRLTRKILDGAENAGAEAIVVACPLCQANLDTRQEEISRESGKEYALPVLYFTELIGLALAHGDTGKWWKKHFVDPRRLLAAKGFI